MFDYGLKTVVAVSRGLLSLDEAAALYLLVVGDDGQGGNDREKSNGKTKENQWKTTMIGNFVLNYWFTGMF